MLLPQEIRNHEFTRAIRGYTTAEVDEYIDFLAEKFESLNREYDELDRKLAIALNKLEELQAREARIARLDTEMRRAAAHLLHEAETQKNKILEGANAYAKRITEEADAHVAAQRNLRGEMQEEILRFKNDLYARYGQHIDQLEEIAKSSEAMAFDNPPTAAPMIIAPADEAEPLPEPVDEVIDTDPAEEIAAADASEDFGEIENLEELESLKAIEEIESLEKIEDIEQMDLFDSVDDTEAIHKELEEMMGTEDIWTDYTDAITEEEIDPGFALSVSEETEEMVSDETNEPTDDDELLLQNLRRAFSVEFDTFDSTKSSKKPPENEDEFAFVENEPPKKRGFLSRLIGGDSDED